MISPEHRQVLTRFLEIIFRTLGWLFAVCAWAVMPLGAWRWPMALWLLCMACLEAFLGVLRTEEDSC